MLQLCYITIIIRKAEEIVDSKLNFKAPEIESCEYVYKKTENGTYRLNVKLVSENNQQYSKTYLKLN